MEESVWTQNLKRIESAVSACDAIPQLGALPPFPYDTLTQALSAHFNLPALSIKEGESRWTPHSEALNDLGDPVTQITLAAPPYEGEFFFALPTEGLRAIMQSLLSGDPYSAALYDSDLREGFVNFVAVSVLKHFQETGYPITPVLGAKKPLAEGPLFVRHLSIGGLASPIPARLILSTSFCHAIRTEYEEMKPPLSPELAKTLSLKLSTEVGEVSLSREEWKNLAQGDFISLDTCTVNSTGREGSVRLTLQGRPLFIGEMSPQGVTITGIAR